jgi:anti-sigma regulatory factor (Ser/Thr protein kinase)
MVNELAHMLAELMENALAFSPPDLEIEIYGRKLGSKYMVAVVDHGVGMSREQLERANARLRGEEDFIVAPTRFLGHYVVGQLAQRLGVEVELTVSPVNGIVARLLLPEELLATEPAPEPSKPSPKPKPVPKPTPIILREPVPELEPIRWPDEDDMPAPAAPPVERTRNGLVKRNPKRSSSVARPTPVRPAAPRTATAEVRSPDDVRTMLSNFRSGHERGTADKEESR